jgi:2'-5' RNA ligase
MRSTAGTTASVVVGEGGFELPPPVQATAVNVVARRIANPGHVTRPITSLDPTLGSAQYGQRMSARSRLGIVVLIAGTTGVEVDGLRRALGARALQRIPPHITLVPPFNVADERVAGVVDDMRAAAAIEPPFVVTLGAAATFWPDNPVVYLRVGDDSGALQRLHDRLAVAPDPRPFVPHVTVAENVAPARIPSAVEVLDSYAADVTIRHLHLLQHDAARRRWDAIADVPLGGGRVVGRGGLEVALDVGSVVDPRAAQLGETPFVVTARREGFVVGFAAGTTGADLVLDRLIVDVAVRGQGVGAQVLAEVLHVGATRGCAQAVFRGHSDWLAAHGWIARAAEMVRTL